MAFRSVFPECKRGDHKSCPGHVARGHIMGGGTCACECHQVQEVQEKGVEPKYKPGQIINDEEFGQIKVG